MTFLSAGVHAESILVAFTATAPNGANTDFNYDVSLTSSSKLVANESFFIIYDFAGYVGASEALLDNWTITPELSSALPADADVTPADDASVTNVRFTYTGPTDPVLGAQSLGSVTLTSLYKNKILDNFVGYDRKVNPGQIDDNTAQGNIGRTVVAAVPLPGIAWAGMGLFGLLGGVGGLKKLRRRGEALA